MFKKSFITTVAALASCAALTAPVQAATVLTFDAAGVMQNGYTDSYGGIGDTYTQNGYTLTVGAGRHFDTMNTSGLYFHNGPANDILDVWARLTFSGGLFDLNSFKFNFSSGEIRTNLNPATTVYATGVNNVTLTGLSWVEFSPMGNGANDTNALYLDDVTVDATKVPEPSTLAIFGLGMLGFGMLRARKR